jgi:hypothetical protein
MWILNRVEDDGVNVEDDEVVAEGDGAVLGLG